MIKEIFEDSKYTYGSRRIAEGLKVKYGVIFNRKKIQRIMNKYYLKPRYYKEPKYDNNKKRLEENVNCPRHGRCCECVAHHRAMGNAPNCYKESGIILVPEEPKE